jgi:hypothetical protein
MQQWTHLVPKDQLIEGTPSPPPEVDIEKFV